MNRIYKTAEGERLVRERYLAFLKYWPVPNQQIRINTSQGETFVVVSGPESAPPLVLLHGGGGNSVMWMAEVRAFAEHFRVYVIDLIGEPGLSAPSRPRLASDAHTVWLDEVLQGLSVDRASMVGVSLGGWLALDYATRRPGRVEKLAVLCPAGIGRQKVGIVFATLVLRMCGAWGKRKLVERVLGRPPAASPPAAKAGTGPGRSSKQEDTGSLAAPGSVVPASSIKAFIDFVSLINRHFRHRMVKFPILSDDALRRLDMPVLAIVGGRDVLLDSAQTRDRLERHAPKAEVVYLPETGHLILGQNQRVLAFLQGSCAPVRG